MSRQIDISKNYITIQGFMVQDLNLKGNELLLYALIYGFSQSTENEFTGSVAYMCKWLNCAKNTVFKTLKSLVDSGLIIKTKSEQNGVPQCSYICSFGGGAKIAPLVQNLQNNDSKDSINNDKNTESSAQSPNIVDSMNSSTENELCQNEKSTDSTDFQGGSAKIAPPVQNLHHQFNNCTTGSETARGWCKNCTGGSAKTEPNNIYNNINNNILFDDDEDIAHARKKIKEQIEYSHFEQYFSANLPCIDVIVEIMLEVSLTDSKRHLDIFGVSTKLFKERLSEIDSTHIEYILACVKNANNIGNIKSYLAKMIFNAPSTIDAYYDSQVKKDFNLA